MNNKWSNIFIIFTVIAAFLVVVGVYLHINVNALNNRIHRIRDEGKVTTARMVKFDSTDYSDGQKHIWGYIIDGVELERDTIADGTVREMYTETEAEEMGFEVEVYYLIDGDKLLSEDKAYADSYKDVVSLTSIVLYIMAAASLGLSLYYIIRNIVEHNILKKGESSIGRFEEAYHSKFGSQKYYMVKYTFIRDGEAVTAVSPEYYNSKEAERLRDLGTFEVRYIGKRSVINPNAGLFK